jgi:hypothetical protein
MMTPMTPDHPRWDEFCDLLEGPQGCDFRYDPPTSTDPKCLRWTCAGGRDQSSARRLLTMLGFSREAIDESCAFFDAHGGYCDCEILFNVDRAHRESR